MFFTYLFLSMCLFDDNKLPNESVQSYSIIATTVATRWIKLADESFREDREIREKVEGEKAAAITRAEAIERPV